MPNHALPPIDIWQTLAFLLDKVKKETPPKPPTPDNGLAAAPFMVACTRRTCTAHCSRTTHHSTIKTSILPASRTWQCHACNCQAVQMQGSAMRACRCYKRAQTQKAEACNASHLSTNAANRPPSAAAQPRCTSYHTKPFPNPFPLSQSTRHAASAHISNPACSRQAPLTAA